MNKKIKEMSLVALLVTLSRLLVVAEFVTDNFQLKNNMMRNENMIEPLNPQCVQTSVSGCFCKDVDLEKPKCDKQCELCKRLELEYSFKN